MRSNQLISEFRNFIHDKRLDEAGIDARDLSIYAHDDATRKLGVLVVLAVSKAQNSFCMVWDKLLRG